MHLDNSLGNVKKIIERSSWMGSMGVSNSIANISGKNLNIQTIAQYSFPEAKAPKSKFL